MVRFIYKCNQGSFNSNFNLIQTRNKFDHKSELTNVCSSENISVCSLTQDIDF